MAVSRSSLVLLLLGTSEQPGMGHVPTRTCWTPAWQPAATPWLCHSAQDCVTVEVTLKLVAWAIPLSEAVGREVMAAARPCQHPCQDAQGQELPVPDPGAPEVHEQPLGQV